MLSHIPEGFWEIRENKEEMADRELIRIGFIAELDAINLYEQLAELSEDPHVRRVFLDIAREEKEHVGEFLELLRKLDKEQVKALEKGAEEVKKIKKREVR